MEKKIENPDCLVTLEDRAEVKGGCCLSTVKCMKFIIYFTVDR